jgi:hypothetical protein
MRLSSSNDAVGMTKGGFMSVRGRLRSTLYDVCTERLADDLDNLLVRVQLAAV